MTTFLSKIVAVTVPKIESTPDINTGESFVAYAARVSNPSNQANPSTSGLVKYLIKNQHWSPFEMVHVCMEINTTRDIARQILRHRSFSFQEFSQRYADASQLGFEGRECRLQDPKNRQNSITINTDSAEAILVPGWTQLQVEVIDFCTKKYKAALDAGIAKEQTHTILPEGLTKSRLYMSGTLRSWIHYCELRMSNGTQKEHMNVAKSCWEELRNEFPNIIEACEHRNNA